jgi:Transposase DDE domain
MSPARAQCTTAEFGNGRTVAIAENEQLQQRLRKQIQTAAGRGALRERTMIEHKLAHISQRQGNHARYVGVRKITFDLRRASAIQNLATLHRSEVDLRKAA